MLLDFNFLRQAVLFSVLLPISGGRLTLVGERAAIAFLWI
jgi:hypothetical protein